MSTGLTTTYSRGTRVNREQLIVNNLGYVARILSTMKVAVRDEEARENLHSAGVVGLVEAANSFDPERGVSFRTHAYTRIRGAIVDELRKLTPVSPAVLSQITIVRKTYETLEPPVTPETLAEHSGLSLDEVMTCLEAMRFLKPDQWSDLSDTVAAAWERSDTRPDAALEHQELKSMIADAIEALPERERLVVTLYYHEELNLAEIGAAMDLSESRISRILAVARFRLQELIRCKTN